MGEQRLVLADVAAHQDHRVDTLKLGDLDPEGRIRGSAGIVTEIALTQPVIDIVGTKAARKARQQIALLNRDLRRGQRRKRLRPVCGHDLAQAGRRSLEGHIPIDLAPLPVHAQEWHRKTGISMQRRVAEAITVRDPGLVYGLVFLRQDTHDLVAAGLHQKIGADAIMRAQRTLGGKFPRARGVTERLRGQGAHRA